MDSRERLTKIPRANTSSPRKTHFNQGDIFREARKVRSWETYLLSSIQNKQTKLEEFDSPTSKYSKHANNWNSNSH